MRKLLTELIPPFYGKKFGQHINGKIFSVIENLYRKTKACVDVNGSLTDLFECRVGVRHGDNLSPLLFIIFMNDFQKHVSSKITGISLSFTLLFSETAEEMQSAINATLSY